MAAAAGWLRHRQTVPGVDFSLLYYWFGAVVIATIGIVSIWNRR
jgi:hypothetical protein